MENTRKVSNCVCACNAAEIIQRVSVLDNQCYRPAHDMTRLKISANMPEDSVHFLGCVEKFDDQWQVDPAAAAGNGQAHAMAISRRQDDLAIILGHRLGGVLNQIEQRLKSEFAEFIGGSDVETRPLSGQMANEIVFKGLVKFLSAGPEGFPSLSSSRRLSCVMNNNLNFGGHLSAQPFGALFNFTEDNIINFPTDEQNPYKMDADKFIALVDENRPALIVFGKSLFLHPEPIGQVKSFLDTIPDYRPLVMYDGAHVLGILGPLRRCRKWQFRCSLSRWECWWD